MKYRSTFVTILLFSLVGFVTGCATFKDYKPKTAAEEEIMTTLNTYFDSWSNHDADGVLSVIHEDAKLMTGRERNVLDKKQFAEYLPNRFKTASDIRKGSPKMSVRGDEATVTVPFNGPDWQLSWVVKLVKENGKWFILSTKY